MSFIIPSFKGLVQVVDPTRLDPSQATSATNCRFDSGSLVPYRDSTIVLDTGRPAFGEQTIFKYDATRWVRWDKAVNVARMPATDQYGRIYYTGTGIPRVSDSGQIVNGAAPAGRAMGIPRPRIEQFSIPQPDIPGQGTIAWIDYYGKTAGNDHSATVLANDAHQLASTDTVTFDFPGINAGAAYVVKPISTQEFRPKGLALPIKSFNWLVRIAATAPTVENVICNCTNHGFASGDLVTFMFSNPSDTSGLNVAAVNYVGNAYYSIDVLDGNRFVVVGLAASNGGVEQRLEGRAKQFVMRVSDVANPANFSSCWWDAPNAQIIVRHAPATSQNTYVSASVATRLQATAYQFTFVNGYGQEGPPSLPSATLTVLPGTTTINIGWWSLWPGDATVALRGDDTPVHWYTVADPNGWYVTIMRIYRTDSTGAFRFMRQVSVFQGQAQDAVNDAALGEVLSTTGYIDPPDSLSGLICTPNGVFIGYSGKDVLASVPYQPHAWPLAYRVKSDYDIKGLVATGAGVIVLTDGFPALLTGNDPASWGMVKLEIPQACVSSRSIVDMGEWGMYAGPDGLVAIQMNDAKVATAALFNREQWKAMAPANLIGAFTEGRYVGLSGSTLFIFDPATGDFSWLSLGSTVLALYQDLQDDTLYFLTDDGMLRAFNRATEFLEATWISKVFAEPRPTRLIAAQLVADGPVEYRLTGDDAAHHSQRVTDDKPFRLPGLRRRDWQVTLNTRARVRFVAVAESIAELRQV